MPRHGFKIPSTSRFSIRRHPVNATGHSPYAAAANARKKTIENRETGAPTATIKQYNRKGQLRRFRPDQLTQDVVKWLSYVPGSIPRQVQPAVKANSTPEMSLDEPDNDTDPETDVEDDDKPQVKQERHPRALRRVSSLVKEARLREERERGYETDSETDDEDVDQANGVVDSHMSASFTETVPPSAGDTQHNVTELCQVPVVSHETSVEQSLFSTNDSQASPFDCKTTMDGPIGGITTSNSPQTTGPASDYSQQRPYLAEPATVQISTSEPFSVVSRPSCQDDGHYIVPQPDSPESHQSVSLESIYQLPSPETPQSPMRDAVFEHFPPSVHSPGNTFASQHLATSPPYTTFRQDKPSGFQPTLFGTQCTRADSVPTIGQDTFLQVSNIAQGEMIVDDDENNVQFHSGQNHLFAGGLNPTAFPSDGSNFISLPNWSLQPQTQINYPVLEPVQPLAFYPCQLWPPITEGPFSSLLLSIVPQLGSPDFCGQVQGSSQVASSGLFSNATPTDLNMPFTLVSSVGENFLHSMQPSSMQPGDTAHLADSSPNSSSIPGSISLPTDLIPSTSTAPSLSSAPELVTDDPAPTQSAWWDSFNKEKSRSQTETPLISLFSDNERTARLLSRASINPTTPAVTHASTRHPNIWHRRPTKPRPIGLPYQNTKVASEANLARRLAVERTAEAWEATKSSELNIVENTKYKRGWVRQHSEL